MMPPPPQPHMTAKRAVGVAPDPARRRPGINRAAGPSRRRGFSLVELLVVIAIVALIFSLVATGITSSLQTQAVTAAAERLRAEINHAALLAQTDNRAVEFRFYRYSDPALPDDSPTFRGYQLVVLDRVETQGQTVVPHYAPLTSQHRLEGGVVLLEDPQFSTILRPPYTTRAAGDPDFGVESYEYVSFQLRPDGSTTLPKDEPACLTLIQERARVAGLADGTLPDDYRSLTVNPFNGRVRIY